jgi:cation diffusion facilitator family transporter
MDPAKARAQQLFAIRLSFAVGLLMFAGKTYAYFITGSAAILSDAAESVVHVIAVSFAFYSMWLSHQPPDKSHPYGHDRIGFFSAGFEGAMITLAALFIIFEAVRKWAEGLHVERLDTGTMYVTAAALINAALGAFLIWRGRRHQSLILIANGRHVLTDVWTSVGVIVGLVLVMVTGWLPFDPIFAIFVATNILWTGGRLMRQSVGGLMDEADPVLERLLRTTLDRETAARGLAYHEFRYRNSGTSVWVDVHLLFPAGVPVEDAHASATAIETAVQQALTVPVTIITHIEPAEAHDRAHRH